VYEAGKDQVEGRDPLNRLSCRVALAFDVTQWCMEYRVGGEVATLDRMGPLYVYIDDGEKGTADIVGSAL